MTFHNSEFDEDRIAYEAFLTIQRDFYTNPPKNIPEFRPFKNPEVFDINKAHYESPVLCMIIDAVRHVFREILQQQYPGQSMYELSYPSHELKRISWKVFGLLRLAPVRERDENDKIIARYDPVRYHDHF
ncbi:hypothetical protein H6768_03690 [Candidatus Peribacteria bacterium]|nr:hypothetical protein [Candidatus Peribacteria bacterium]